MEIVILICLLVIIALLLPERLNRKKPVKQEHEKALKQTHLPDIMGVPKLIKSHIQPIATEESQVEIPGAAEHNFESETGTGKFLQVIPEEELADVFTDTIDWEEEEEEWRRSRGPGGENGFATGVTFEELSTVGLLLQQEEPEPALQNKAVDIVQKIHGTELFSLLENSIEGASQKIAQLLDKQINSAPQKKNGSLDGFDIGEFV